MKIFGWFLAFLGFIGMMLSSIGLGFWWAVGIISMVVHLIAGAGVLTIIGMGICWAATAVIGGFIGLLLGGFVTAIGVEVAN